ncbi:MAG: hypothetical protein OEZ02_11395 [Anaerolineae bacterium]|nr:hypothetical protein [Anaerolineae bacterium]
MKLTPPTKKVFWASVVLAVVGVVLHFFVDAYSAYGVYALLVGYLLLAAGNTMKGF